MATKSWFLTATTGNNWRTIDEATQAAANSTDGWTVSTGSANASEYFVGVNRAATTFVNTTPPDGTLDLANRDAFRSTNPLCGDFDTASWVFHFVVRATVANSQAGRAKFRVLVADADGSNAREITSGQQTGSTVTLTATGTDFDSTLTVSLGAFSVRGQYLFVQFAWERTGAGSMTTNDVIWRTGSSSSLGTRITSANFVEVPAPGTQQTTDRQQDVSFYSLRARRVAFHRSLLAQSLGTFPAIIPTADTTTITVNVPIWGPKPPPRWDSINLLTSTLGTPVVADPFVGREFPLPPRVPKRVVFEQPPALLQSTLDPNPLSPLTTTDWSLPRGRGRAKVIDPPNTAQFLTDAATVTPFTPIAWVNPVRARAARAGDPPNTAQFLTDATVIPYPAVAWPNPPRAKAAQQPYPQNVLPTTFAPIPFTPVDFPIVAGKRRQVGEVVPSSPLLLGIVPTTMTDWPIPAARRRLSVINPPNTLQALVDGSQAPFGQTDWPNPIRRARRQIDDLLVPRPFYYDEGKPNHQDAWEVPRGRRGTIPTEAPNLLGSTLATQTPFALLEWPVPLRRRAVTQGWTAWNYPLRTGFNPALAAQVNVLVSGGYAT